MIFTTIWTRKNDNSNNLGKQLATRVENYKISVSVYERTNNGRLSISGEGQHQKEDIFREDEFSVKCEQLTNPDYLDEFKIIFDKDAVISICQAALERKLVKISEIIPETLEAEIYKNEDDLYVAFENLKELFEKMKP